jgi:hypothetical protein
MLNASCDILIVDLQEQDICMNFSSDSGKLYQKCLKCSEQLLVPVPWGEHRLLNGFVNSNMWKYQLKIVCIQVVPPQVTQTKH